MNYDFTVQTQKSFDEAVTSVTLATEQAGFRVLHIHNVQETLNNKGFSIESLKTIEVCNAKNAYEAIQKNIALALMLPCKINVYVQKGAVFISALRPAVITKLFPDIELDDLVADVDKKLTEIVEQAK